MKFSLFISASLLSTAYASFFVTNPIASTVVRGNTTLTINWLADTGVAAGVAPLASTYGATKVQLMTGSSTQQTVVMDLGTIKDASRVFKFPVVIPKTAGPNSPYYFLKFTGSNSSAPMAFSARFSMSQMTGSFTSTENSQNSAIGSTNTDPVSAVSTGTGALSSSSLTSLTSSSKSATSVSGSSSSSSTTSTSSSAAATKAGGVGRVTVGASVVGVVGAGVLSLLFV